MRSIGRGRSRARVCAQGLLNHSVYPAITSFFLSTEMTKWNITIRNDGFLLSPNKLIVNYNSLDSLETKASVIAQI